MTRPDVSPPPLRMCEGSTRINDGNSCPCCGRPGNPRNLLGQPIAHIRADDIRAVWTWIADHGIDEEDIA